MYDHETFWREREEKFVVKISSVLEWQIALLAMIMNNLEANENQINNT